VLEKQEIRRGVNKLLRLERFQALRGISDLPLAAWR